MFSHNSAVPRFLGHNLSKRRVWIFFPFSRRALLYQRFKFVGKIFIGCGTLIINLLILIVPVSSISQSLVQGDSLSRRVRGSPVDVATIAIVTECFLFLRRSFLHINHERPNGGVDAAARIKAPFAAPG
jgi:hypothetical protein